MRVVLAWGAVAALMFALFPLVYGRENKCTSASTAFMLAKRFTVERNALSIDDQPDFPWDRPGAVLYQGDCTHRVSSWFDRVANGERQRTAYVATVRYDPPMNRWTLLDWAEAGEAAPH
jgi:hypothetical protein